MDSDDPFPHQGLRSSTNTNSTNHLQSSFEIDLDDTTWILTSAFIIFTMQTGILVLGIVIHGFGMLEAGYVSVKNEANIMMKNFVDIGLGGLTYWIFGYGMSFGQGPYTNPFIGLGDFFVDPPVGDELMGPIFAAFLFQLSFATTATTICSGAMAERCNFKAYCLFSLLNTAVYCIPAGWVWGSHGFLNHLGAVDIAGSGPVHLIGGAASFASALMLGPRLGRYAQGTAPLPLGSPVNAVMGTFVLWWGWLAFNSGSTYGVTGSKWQYAARAAVMTMMGSFGGGCFGLLFTLIKNSGKADVVDLINSILGSLVSVTAGCFLYRAWEALLIGVIGGIIASFSAPLFDRFGVDDPVAASAIHGCCGFWGVVAVGLFADNPIPLDTTGGRSGLFKGGGWHLLGVQSISAVCLLVWGVLSTLVLLWIIDKILPLRMDPYEELLGADLTEHNIRHGNAGLSRAVSALRPFRRSHSVEELGYIGQNAGHNNIVEHLYQTHLNKEKGRKSLKEVIQAYTRRRGDVTKTENFRPPSRHSNAFAKPEIQISAVDAYEGYGPSPLQTSHSKTAVAAQLLSDSVKHKSYRQLTPTELHQLGALNASQDRFRHRFNLPDYEDDIRRASAAWID